MYLIAKTHRTNSNKSEPTYLFRNGKKLNVKSFCYTASFNGPATGTLEYETVSGKKVKTSSEPIKIYYKYNNSSLINNFFYDGESKFNGLIHSLSISHADKLIGRVQELKLNGNIGGVDDITLKIAAT